MRRILLSILLVSAGPAHAQYYYDQYSEAMNLRPTVLTAPEKGERTVVTAGESILDQRNGRLADGAIVDATYSSPPKVANEFNTVPGDAFFQVASKAAFKACGVRLGSEGSPPCFLDDDGDGVFDRVASNSLRKARPVGKPISYRKETVLLPPFGSGFTRSILYQGATAEALKLSYREFNNNLARPAFEEDLLIPLGRDFPQKVAAKGAIFTIYKIDGLGMDYQVDDPGSFAATP